jgi:hypothetical protein
MKELYKGEKIGEFLVRIGAMTQEQLTECLKIKSENPAKLFGLIAIEKGYINDKAIDQYLEALYYSRNQS